MGTSQRGGSDRILVGGGVDVAAAIDETIADTSALVAALRAAGGLRERRIAAQLALTAVSLASASTHLAHGPGGE